MSDYTIRSDENNKWFEEFIKVQDGKLQNILYMSYIIEAGTKLTCYLQKTALNFKEYDSQTKFFPDSNYQSIKKITFTGEKRVVKNVNPNLDKTTPKASALKSFISQIKNYLTTATKSSFKFRKILFPNKLLNLHSLGGKYSISLFKEILKEIKPQSNDALYDGSSPIYNADNPHYDPADANFWLKKTTRFTVSGTTKELNKIGSEILTKKEFYKAWLLIMQNDLLKFEGGVWVMNQDSQFYNPDPQLGFQNILFTDGDPYQPESFSPESDIQSADIPLTSKLDIILQDIFGTVGYTSLFTGLMTFSEESSGNFIVDFIQHSIPDTNTLNRRFGIRDLSLGKTRYIKSGSEFELYYINLFLNGFAHNFKGQSAVNFVAPDREAFLNEYFEVYRPLESLDFVDATNIFLEEYLSTYGDQATIYKKSLIGQDKIYEFLANKVDGIIDAFFSSYGGYTMYEQFLENPNYWAYRTRKQAKSYLRIFLESASSTTDFIKDLRRILQTGMDGFINLKSSITGGSGLTKNYGGNPLFDNGLEIPIKYTELLDFLSIDDVSDEALFVLQSKDSYLDFGYFWAISGEKTGDKLIAAYTKYKNMFTQANLGQWYNKRYRINFYSDKGGGIPTRLISNRFSSYGIRTSTIEFNPRDPDQLHNAIASMVTYMYLLPDAFIDVKIAARSAQHFLFADLFSLHTLEYVHTTTYTSNIIGGTFMWDRNEGSLTRDNYNNYMNEINGIFDHTDQHHFLAFDSSFDDILNTLTQFFRNKVDGNIQIQDFRI